jgi:hypothetical protein
LTTSIGGESLVGVLSASATLELSDAVGQPEAGAPLGGRPLAFVDGFWPAAAGKCSFRLANLDGGNDVDLAELAQLLGHYGMTSGAEYGDGDLNGDGDVDLGDLTSLLGVYGTSGE